MDSKEIRRDRSAAGAVPKPCRFRRIVVKVGSNVLTRRDGTLDEERMAQLVGQLARLHDAGVETILVSSGAVASGRGEVHVDRRLDDVTARQL